MNKHAAACLFILDRFGMNVRTGSFMEKDKPSEKIVLKTINVKDKSKLCCRWKFHSKSINMPAL